MRPILASLITTATAFALGLLSTRKLDVPSPIRFAAGAALLHLIVFGLMLAGQARLPVFAIVAAAALLPMLRYLRFAWPVDNARVREPVVVCVFAVFAALYLINALAPEIQADANTYHLMPAIEAARSGGFSVEISFYERLPHATELLFVFAYTFGGAPAAKLLHLIFLFWTLPLIVLVGRRLGMPNPLPGIAAAMYFVTPVAGVSGTSAFNDAALVFYVMATVWMLLAWREARSGSFALLAGVLAGMCYAIKMNGGIAIAVSAAFMLAFKEWPALLPLTIGACAVTLPWLVRNAIEIGNPFAPFLNGVFANRYFYSGPEHALAQELRSYGVPFLSRFWEVAAGSRLQGMIGPVFLAAPLTLLAFRQRTVRWLWLFAIVFSSGWWMNAGARFLMPSLPFLALAFTAAFRRVPTLVLLTAHAVLSWPWVISTYSPRVWRLTDFPWRAAIGLERPNDYLGRISWDYRLARLIEENTQPGSRTFAIAGVQGAYLARRLVGPWQSAEGHRFLASLELARVVRNQPLNQWRADFSSRPVTAVRLRFQTAATNWSINELLLYHDGDRVLNRRAWQLDASVNRWDTPFAFDSNSTSRWSTWRNSTSRDFFVVEFGRPEMLDSVRATVYESGAQPIAELRNRDGAWISFPMRHAQAARVRSRLEAIELLARSGVTHIVTPAAPVGVGVLGQYLVDEADEWGLDVVTHQDATYLLRIRQTP